LLGLCTDFPLFWCDIDRSWSRGNKYQVEKRMADCSSFTPGTVRLQIISVSIYAFNMALSCYDRHVFLMSTSWKATAPFLQFGAVGALTLLSSFVFQSFHMAKGGTCQTLDVHDILPDIYTVT